MEPETGEVEEYLVPLKKVTPLSRYLALTLFVILPFLGGWIGYMYAPEKVAEVERVVVKEVEVEKEMQAEVSAETSGVTIAKEVESSYAYLSNDGGSKNEYKIFDGDISDDSILVSPNNEFIQFKGIPCSFRGGHCVGQLLVFDVVDETSYPIEVRGDENAPYNLEDDPSLATWMSPFTAYGKITKWNDQNHLVYEVDYKGAVYTYESISIDEPWILEYKGVVE